MSDKPTTITVKEFRMWLEGVEEMQDDNWVPSATQWKRIREKIDTINDEPQQPVARSAPVQLHQPASFAPAFEPPPGMAVPAGPSSLAPATVRPVMQPSAPVGGLFANPDNPTMPVRTPNIDTANGQYQSTFA